jgi:hypothetical protein
MNINKIKVSPEIWVSLYSELSNFILERSSLDNIWMLDENGDERMTDDKQDEFNYLVDKVETIMRDSGLVKQEVQ